MFQAYPLIFFQNSYFFFMGYSNMHEPKGKMNFWFFWLGLTYTPCLSTVLIGKIVYKFFNIFKNDKTMSYKILLETILRNIDKDNVFLNFNCENEHKEYFLDFIVKEFIRMRAVYIAKTSTLNEQKRILRKQLSKAIHFRGKWTHSDKFIDNVQWWCEPVFDNFYMSFLFTASHRAHRSTRKRHQITSNSHLLFVIGFTSIEINKFR